MIYPIASSPSPHPRSFPPNPIIYTQLVSRKKGKNARVYEYEGKKDKKTKTRARAVAAWSPYRP